MEFPIRPLQETDLEQEVVFKNVSKHAQLSTKYMVEVNDLGGQDVFQIFYNLYLKPSSIFLVVFNMERMMSEPEDCMKYVRKWMNLVNLYSSVNGQCAPIFLIGTHKDLVSNPAVHQEISTRLYSLHTHPAWATLVMNKKGIGAKGDCNLHFFPINNREGRRDASLRYLLTCVERCVDGLKHVLQERPLLWMKILDEMRKRANSASKSYFKKEEARAIATELSLAAGGVPMSDEEYHAFLSFLNQVGAIFWKDTEGLGDYIIMDPVAFLINPCCNVICKHVPRLE
jgi:hypothetical protein